MSFRVEITRRVAREIEEQYRWIAERLEAAAERWRASLLEAVSSLEVNPERCPEAPEGEWYGPGLRQLVHGKKRHAHRILFEVRGNRVIVLRVLRVRHGAQDLLGPDPL